MNTRPTRSYEYHRVAGLLSVTGIAILLAFLFSPAFAHEPGGKQVSGDAQPSQLSTATLMSPRLADTGALELLRRRVHEMAVTGRSTDRQKAESQLEVEADDTPQIIEEAAELECLPLLKLSDDNQDRKIYFGIGFDGTVGIHGKL